MDTDSQNKKTNSKKMEQQNKEGNFHGDNAERQRRHSETNELKAKGRQSEYVSDTHRTCPPAGHDSGGHTNSCIFRELLFKSSTNLSRFSPCGFASGFPAPFPLPIPPPFPRPIPVLEPRPMAVASLPFSK